MTPVYCLVLEWFEIMNKDIRSDILYIIRREKRESAVYSKNVMNINWIRFLVYTY